MSDETKNKYNQNNRVHNEHPEAGHTMEDSGIGSGIGATVGASMAAIAAIGTSLVIPGLGLIIAGPIAAAFAGAGAGSLAAGLIGAFAGMGIGDDEAKIYNKKVEDAKILVGVQSKDENDYIILKNNVL